MLEWRRVDYITSGPSRHAIPPRFQEDCKLPVAGLCETREARSVRSL